MVLISPQERSRSHLVDELSVKDNREGTVALTDQHRGAEVCKGSHEHQQSCSQQGGHDQGHDHFEEAGNGMFWISIEKIPSSKIFRSNRIFISIAWIYYWCGKCGKFYVDSKKDVIGFFVFSY